jgi:hypothetical protein
MSSPIDDRYFEWLYGQIGAVSNRNPARSYWNLCRKLFQTEFFWSVPNDDNRVEDGKDLRHEFIGEQGSVVVDPDWMDLGCSVFEMMVGLARRAYFQTDKPETDGWFRKFLVNLGLDMYTDANYNEVSERYVDEILDRFINRHYRRNGRGGLFPLENPNGDQTKVELWYQMHAYIIENNMV